MKYNKPHTDFDGQVDLLIQRGMIVSNREQARYYLQHLNYYRLSGYWLPFEVSRNPHQFASGTNFEQVIDLYVFDRELRLLVIDAVERIEVSVRTQWAYHLSEKYGPHAHLDSGLFFKQDKYLATLGKLTGEIARSKEAFIQHLLDAYDETTPPIWAVVEVMSFGQLSQFYANLKLRQDRKSIADTYNLDEKVLGSFLHQINTIRNACAHHSRLWNRRFTMQMIIPGKRPAGLQQNFNRDQMVLKKIYNPLVMLAYLMDRTCPSHHFKTRLKDLLDQHNIDEDAMGFPRQWRALPIWN
ncbi:MAG: DNA-binding protein [endosymbiont of Escarpia spicata]|uniref:DNA-binding protein n=1 Tax=endosymbiont of Escarpia spicata TaxID=2200908 RepID=A0A370DAM0_9GAMM|nr:MAG: DNA-binding protein [endosymbiont of Escarpia spicata]